ncbi:MAG: hypothetical protein GF418_15040 [Chitinivibrionales bacterium]|nr:hypothetical protein [Chitinivibrionales bacterium]
MAFCVTLGPAIDALIAQYQKNALHEAVVVDHVASITADVAADNVRAALQDRLPSGRALTKRYSPGHCDWPLHDQAVLFSLLGNAAAHVDLSDRFIMTPRKSITAVAGIGPEETVGRYGNACDRCAHRGCAFRTANRT